MAGLSLNMDSIEQEVEKKANEFEYQLSTHEIAYKMRQLQDHVTKLGVTKRESLLEEGTLVWQFYEQLKRDQQAEFGRKPVPESINRLHPQKSSM